MKKYLAVLLVGWMCNVFSGDLFELAGTDTVAIYQGEQLNVEVCRNVISTDSTLDFAKNGIIYYPYAVTGEPLEISFIFKIKEQLTPEIYPILGMTNQRTVLSACIRQYPNQSKQLFNVVRFLDDGKPVACKFYHAFETEQEYQVRIQYSEEEVTLFLDGQEMGKKTFTGKFFSGSRLKLGDENNSLPMSLGKLRIVGSTLKKETAMVYDMKPGNWQVTGEGLTLEALPDGQLKIIFAGGDQSATLWATVPVYTAQPDDHIRAAGKYRIIQSEYGSMFILRLNAANQPPVTTMSGDRYQKPTQQSKPIGEADRFDFSIVGSEETPYLFNMMFYGNPQTVILEEAKVFSIDIIRPSRPPVSPENRAYDRSQVDASLATLMPVQYQLKRHSGRMELLLDGKAVSPVIYRRGPHYPSWTRYALFRDAGIDLYYFQALLGKASETHKMGVANLWRGNNQYDFSAIAEELRVIHAINPKARVILWVGLGIYEGWDNDYPDAVFMNAKGEKGYLITTGKTIFYGEEAEKAHKKRFNEEFSVAPSYYSEEFKTSAANTLGALARYLEKEPAGKIVCGIHITGASDGQFFPLDRDVTRGEDHSPAAKRAWSAYLRKIYGNDVAALRRTWNDSQASFENPGIPGNRERGNDNSGIQPSHRGRDYVLFTSCAHSEIRLALFRAIKENSNGRLMTGCYYPPGTTGNYDFDMMMRSPYVDFMIDILRVTPAGSFLLHKKLYIGEMDMIAPDVMVPIYNYVFNRSSFENITRQAVANIVQREGGMYHLFDMSEAYYSNQETVRFFGKVRQEHDAALDNNLTVPPDIAVFCDYKLLAGCSYRSADNLSRLINYSFRHTLEHSGIPFQVYSTKDIINPELQLPKILFFPLIPEFTSEQVAELRKRAKTSKSTIVWGFLRPFKTLPSATFGGYEFLFHSKGALSPLRVTDAQKTGISAGKILGESYTVSGYFGDYLASYETPARIAVGPEDRVLAVYSNDGQPGLISRTVNGIQEYVNGAPGAFSPQFFRQLAKQTGAQVLSNNDNLVVMAENGMLSVLCERGGSIEVKIPDGFQVASCLTGQKYTVSGDRLHFTAGLDFEVFFFKLIPG